MGKLCANFNLFGMSHITLMLVSIVLSVALVLLLKKLDGRTRTYVNWGLIGTMGLLVVLEFIGLLATGGDFFESLPVSPWSIFVYIAIFVQITQRDSWIKFGYFIVVPLSVISLFVTPNYLTTASAWSLQALSYFLTNGLLVSYYILQLIWSGEYLSKKDILTSFLNYIIIVACVHIFNVILRFTTLGVHANYFGTMGEEYDILNKLLYKFIEVPLVHQLPFFALIIGLGFLLILPFDMLKTKKDRQDQLEELVALGNLKAQQNFRKTGHKGGSQILVNSAEKAKPSVPKNSTNNLNTSGFVSVNKQVNVNKDEDNK